MASAVPKFKESDGNIGYTRGFRVTLSSLTLRSAFMFEKAHQRKHQGYQGAEPQAAKAATLLEIGFQGKSHGSLVVLAKIMQVTNDRLENVCGRGRREGKSGVVFAQHELINSFEHSLFSRMQNLVTF
eukprot:gb/GEZJ01005424.1/.p1 GENE.gb/GEZJ01005424.1/~~gb/GEZJ01005424.1/.p1  ORF type:complete len:128 (+),score=7.66 gb/GEZJ01005424.1/:253-636(+)